MKWRNLTLFSDTEQESSPNSIQRHSQLLLSNTKRGAAHSRCPLASQANSDSEEPEPPHPRPEPNPWLHSGYIHLYSIRKVQLCT